MNKIILLKYTYFNFEVSFESGFYIKVENLLNICENVKKKNSFFLITKRFLVEEISRIYTSTTGRCCIFNLIFSFYILKIAIKFPGRKTYFLRIEEKLFHEIYFDI